MKERIILIIILLSLSYPSPSQRKLRNAVLKTFSNDSLLSANVGYFFYNLHTEKEIISFNKKKNFLPASTLKIFTTYSLLKYGSDSILSFYYFFDKDTLHIMPLGDPTFLHQDFKSQKAKDLIKKLNPPNIKIYTNHWKENIWGDGWEWSDYDQGFMPELSPMPVYGNVLTFTKSNFRKIISALDFINYADSHIDPSKIFKRDFSSNTFFPHFKRNKEVIPFLGKNYKTLGFFMEYEFHSNVIFSSEAFEFPKYQIYSYSMTDLIKYYMSLSDNFFAEQLFLQLAYHIVGEMRFKTLTDTLTNRDALLNSITTWKDANGLSRRNLIKPDVMINTLKTLYQMKSHKIFDFFPKVGEGTLSYFYTLPKEKFFAKTGSMSYTFCLSGYLIEKRSRDPIAFTIFINNTEMSKKGILKMINNLFKKLL